MRVLCFLLLVAVTHGATITGKVVGISDGDTLTVLTPAKEQVKVRLHGIDAPESRQAFGTRAKQELSAIAFGMAVRTQWALICAQRNCGSFTPAGNQIGTSRVLRPRPPPGYSPAPQ